MLSILGSIGFLLVPGISTAGETARPEIPARVGGLPIPCATLAAGLPAEEGAEQVEDAIRQLGLLQLLAAEAPPDPEIERQWRRHRERALIARLEATFEDAVQVPESSARAYFDAHVGELRRAERISTRMIFRRLAPGASQVEVAAVRQQLEGWRRQLLDGEADFLALARLHSEAENASRGGAVAASARGSLLEAYEAVAWRLEEGEISGPVRLPDGMALILLERVFPAWDPDFETARPSIEKRLRNQVVEARRKALLEQLRRRHPISLDWQQALGEKAARTPVKIGDRRLLLGELDARLHLPRRRQEVSAALDRALLLAEAESRYLPEMQATLELDLQQRRANLSLGARLDAALPDLPETELEALYRKGEHLLSTPEKRRFLALVVPLDGSDLRAARDRALELRRDWSKAGEPPRRPGVVVERWGPLTRSQLDSATSPRFAKQVFALEAGRLSDPLRLESYSPSEIRFKAEGYVVAEWLETLAPSTPPPEEVKARIKRYVARDRLNEMGQALQRRLLESLDVDLDREALGRCLGRPVASQADPGSS